MGTLKINLNRIGLENSFGKNLKLTKCCRDAGVITNSSYFKYKVFCIQLHTLMLCFSLILLKSKQKMFEENFTEEIFQCIYLF